MDWVNNHTQQIDLFSEIMKHIDRLNEAMNQINCLFGIMARLPQT